MADKNDFSEVIAEILIELQNQREANAKNTERMINSFNTGFTAVIDRLDSMNQIQKEAINQITDINRRVNKLENPE
jgi:predicted secreted protein